jgi:EAL domain-containing protein (putative c-di-GMP-specific phosphodiesterase class I)
MAAHPSLQIAAPTVSSPWVERLGLHPVFQPIVDLATGQALGHEVLSRGTHPSESPEAMFRDAERLGLLWELEQGCRSAALGRLAELAAARRGGRFFLNVGPRVLADPRFLAEFNRDRLRERGLEPERIVIEVTERDAIADYGRFAALVRHFAAQGFQVALDDFGSGHSSLVTLVHCAPRFLKLDQAIVRGIDGAPYQQQLVKALATFSAGVGAELIAEGVETWPELDTLARLGVRLAQGYLLGFPSLDPEGVAPAVRERLTAKGAFSREPSPPRWPTSERRALGSRRQRRVK